MIRALIVDDSTVVRAVLKQVMSQDTRFKVCDICENGEKAVRKCRDGDFDLVVMDYYMPVMDGLEAAKCIFSEHTNPPAVVMFSSETDFQIKACCKEAGVLEFVEKPNLADMTTDQLRSFCDTLNDVVDKNRNYYQIHASLAELKSADSSTVPVVAGGGVDVSPNAGAVPISAGAAVAASPDTAGKSAFADTADAARHPFAGYRALLIGASTGGPDAIQKVLLGIGNAFPLPILVTQHIDSLFDTQFVTWLSHTTGLPVHLAKDGAEALPGEVYITPADRHLNMRMEDGRLILELSQDLPVHFLRPSVDVMFSNAVRCLGSRIIAVLLTGMGRDGAEAMSGIRAAGGCTICQDEASCVVFGMPKAAIDAGAAQKVLPLMEIAPVVKRLVQGGGQ